MTLPEKDPLDDLTEIQDQLNNLVDNKSSTENNSESNSTEKTRHSSHLQMSSQQQCESKTDINFPSISTENSSLVRKTCYIYNIYLMYCFPNKQNY